MPTNNTNNNNYYYYYYIFTAHDGYNYNAYSDNVLCTTVGIACWVWHALQFAPKYCKCVQNMCALCAECDDPR